MSLNLLGGQGRTDFKAIGGSDLQTVQAGVAGVAIEKASSAREFDFAIAEVKIDAKEHHESLQLAATQSGIPPERRVVKPQDGTGSLEAIYRLASERAGRRFVGSLAFPEGLKDVEEGDIDKAVLYCSASREGSHHEPQETAARLMIWAARLINPQEYAPDSGFNMTITEGNEVRGFPCSDMKGLSSYASALGTALSVISVAKPFVSRVTNSVGNMASRLREELSLEEAHLSAESFAAVFKTYLSRIDLAQIARTIMYRKFPGATWLTTYACRVGCGTSHVTAICTFISLYPVCPFYNLIPKAEWVSFEGAIAALVEDPMVLFPVTGTANAELDQYRATAMPSLLVLSIYGLTAHGDPNWKRYQNVPYINRVGAFSQSKFLGSVVAWVESVGEVTDLDTIIETDCKISDLMENFDPSTLGLFIQTGGKVKSRHQRA